MTAAGITCTDRAALKTAARVLVHAVGGLEAAATVCRLNPSALAEAYSPHRPDRFMPADVIADLEAVAGVPHVTAVQARLAGHALVPLPAPGGAEAAAIAEVGRRASAMFADWAMAVADEAVTDAERAAVVDDLLHLQRAVMDAVAALRAPPRTKGTGEG